MLCFYVTSRNQAQGKEAGMVCDPYYKMLWLFYASELKRDNRVVFVRCIDLFHGELHGIPVPPQ